MKRRKMLHVLSHFRVIIQSIRKHYLEVERRAGVSGAQLWALSQVAQQPGMQVGQLAQLLAIHQSTASNLLRGLEGLGVVRRQRDEKDQRHVQLFATRKGHQLLKRAPKPIIGVLQQALLELPGSSLDQLNGELERIVRLMKAKHLEARAILLSQM